MKMAMKQKRVDSFKTPIQKAMKAGVKIVACTMSTGVQQKELAEGVELGGTYIGDAKECNVNLCIKAIATQGALRKTRRVFFSAQTRFEIEFFVRSVYNRINRKRPAVQIKT